MSGILAATFGPSSSVGDPNGWFVRAITGGRTKAGTFVSEWTAQNLTSVYAAVRIISDTVAQLPMHAWQRTDNGRKVADHPINHALRLEPNEHMSSYTLRQTTQKHALFWGNGYQEIERNNKGQGVGIWPLLPENTYPRRKELRGGKVVVQTSIDGEMFELDPRNVAHIKALGHDGYVGLSQIALHRNALGLAVALEEFGSKLFANDAKSGGFLHHPGKLGAKAQDNLKKSLDTQGGLDNAHRIKILEEGMKFIPTTIPPEDAQFLGTREFQIAEVSRIYGVPLILLSSNEKSTSWGTGIEQLIIGFVIWTIQPWLIQWEQEYTRKIFTEAEIKAGFFVKFALQALLRGDMASRAAFYKSLWDVGAMSPNEIRELEDQNTKPGLDKTFVPLNVQPTDSATAPAPTPPPAGKTARPKRKAVPDEAAPEDSE